MRRNVKLSIIFSICVIVITGAIFTINELPKENNFFQKAYFRFRFYIYPDRYDPYYYPYYDPYYDGYYYYSRVRVAVQIYDDYDERVESVQIAGRTFYSDDYYFSGRRHFYISLRPGIYTIRWRVETPKDYRTYS